VARELEERVFLVTGAGGDVRRAVVSGLRVGGASVVASGVLGQADGEALFREAVAVSYFQADVCRPKYVDRLLTAVIDRHRRIGGLVAAGGVAHWATALDQTYEQ
jgi:NAD(P)-dependent dehydrogenase (short-subunit alcohol dehydrogenase family)